MEQYKKLIQHVLEHGEPTDDRTGVGTISCFCYTDTYQIRPISETEFQIPILTTKYIHVKSIIHELLWMISGDTNIKYLNDHGVTIWDEWADKDGNLGPVYGKQWRNIPKIRFYQQHPIFQCNMYRQIGKIDQLQTAIDLIQNDPTSRRIIVDSWNPQDLSQMALTPCHMLYQFKVYGDYLDLLFFIRSNDLGLGFPFNLTFYGLLLCMVSQLTNKIPRNLHYVGGDVHIYTNHIEDLKRQIEREPYPQPSFTIQKRDSIDDYEFDDFKLVNYQHHPKINLEVAV